MCQGQARSLTISEKKRSSTRARRTATGYIHVRLRKDGVATLFKVHVLVAKAFLGYDQKQYDRHDVSTLVVDHLDGVKDNNRLSNLEVVTQAENIARYHERRRKKHGKKSGDSLAAK